MTVNGPVDDVEKAVKLLKELSDKKQLDIIVNDTMCKILSEIQVNKLETTEVSITVGRKHKRHFIARRGEVLRRIRDEFGGVVISFPKDGVAGDKVNLKGARNCIDAAITRISEIVKDFEGMVTIDCEIKQSLHRFE